MLKGLLLALLVVTSPPGATPPPGGTGPVAGEIDGRWELRLRGLTREHPERLVVRFVRQETLVEGQVLVPASAAFVTGKMLGRFYMVALRPIAVPHATASYDLEVSLDPTSTHGQGSVRARLETARGRSESVGSVELTRLDAIAPGGP